MKQMLLFVLLAPLIFLACAPAPSPMVVSGAATLSVNIPIYPAATAAQDRSPLTSLSAIYATAPTATHTVYLPNVIHQSRRMLPQQARWQIQYTGALDADLDVEVFNLDLFDAPAETITTLRQRGVFVMCYFSAGSYEDWRPDAPLFPAAVLGKNMEGWPGEKWLDIRQINLLAPIMESRLDLAAQKGCAGVDPDNVNGYENDTGFPLTAGDQLVYNLFLARAARRRGLAIGLKNDLEQIPELVSYFDWIINEECFTYQECDLLLPFAQAGKPVFVIEYELEPSEFCPQANQMGFNALHKHWELDAYRFDCRE